MRKIKVLHITWSGQKAGMLLNIVREQIKDKELDIKVIFCRDLDGIYAKEISRLGIPVRSLKMKSKYGLSPILEEF